MTVPLLFEASSKNRMGVSLPAMDVPEKHIETLLPKKFLRKTKSRLPELSEPQVVRHFVNLSTLNHHVDKDFYPLGSCTMKYNPKINQVVSAFDGFCKGHPMQPEPTVQGNLKLMSELCDYLCEISGLKGTSLQPSAGAHGELTGLMLIRAFHDHQGDRRKYILIPDSAHGTNPASVTICGYKAITLRSNEHGMVDMEDFQKKLTKDVAALMLTNPNTLGLYEQNVKLLSEMIHSIGGLMYMDGANMNALLGLVKPGELGIDVMHFNLHKTFSTPHGGGGPGAGPVGVSEKLCPYLPHPIIEKTANVYSQTKYTQSIGKVSTFYGNYGVFIKAYTYIKMLGSEGLKRTSQNAILNANYLKSLIEKHFRIPYRAVPMHEFVVSGDRQKKQGVKTLDIAKRLLDYGVHAPTVYFPLIVSEALMIEPTETESKESIENFAQILTQIVQEINENPDVVRSAPHNTPVSRLDEALAARNLNIRHLF